MSINTKKKQRPKSEVLSLAEGSVILLHGCMHHSFFDTLKKRKIKEAVVLEGRPKMESLRSSCRQLLKHKINPTVIADNMAGFLFYKNLVKEVWLSCQDTGRNGAFCDIGALILGVLGKRHHIPVNLYPASGKTALLGRPKEVFYFNGCKVSANGLRGYVPLSEWVPAKYITRTYAL